MRCKKKIKMLMALAVFLTVTCIYAYTTGLSENEFNSVAKNEDINVNLEAPHYAYACGIPIGIYLKSDGVLVIDTGEITDISGEETEPSKGILKSGDYIKSINGEEISDKEELSKAINKNRDGVNTINIIREGETITVNVRSKPTEDGTFKIGAWVRDDTQGIGTLTYIDENGNFGALGHGISDADTGSVMSISDGELYETKIIGIQKGSTGNPGVMSGVIYYGPSYKLGDITGNFGAGIFGNANRKLKSSIHSEKLQIGNRHDVQKGHALLRSAISGTVEDYDIEIQKIDYHSLHKNKSLVIKITDPELIEITGGIVQGMSGSPIIQNGKLVGAVTHVFVQDSLKGYGIFIENMLSDEP